MDFFLFFVFDIYIVNLECNRDSFFNDLVIDRCKMLKTYNIDILTILKRRHSLNSSLAYIFRFRRFYRNFLNFINHRALNNELDLFPI